MHWKLVLFAVVLAGCGSKDKQPMEADLEPVSDPLQWVDPTIGTGGFGYAYGSAFVGAAAPHGLVKVGPDTSGEFGTVSFQHYSGYFAGDNVVESFSHMHLHGAGLTDYGVVGVMPTLAFDAAKTKASDYRSFFVKDSERASAGQYAMTLEPSQIGVELTATTRAAHHRYTFPSGQSGTLVLDLTRSLGSGTVESAELQLDAASQQITGKLHNLGQMSERFGGYTVYLAARTKSPWVAAQQWEQGAALQFAADEPVEMQIALSLVSQAGALANLDAELPAWDFEATAQSTAQAWRELLSAVLVEGGTRESRRMFYSALYRSFLMPTIVSDIDGSYLYGGEQSAMPVGNFVSDLSLWDTYRTLHPLYHLIAPQSGADAVRSLVAMSQVGAGYPRWPIGTGESATMLGASADVVLADAAIKLGDVPGFDPSAVLEQLVTIAADPDLTAQARGGRNPADGYLQFGYVPANEGRSVSTHLEFATDDHAIARMAEALGEVEISQMFESRARSYRRLFDPQTQTYRPLNADGEFPSAAEYDRWAFGEEFAEANAAQMLWAPLHDVAGLRDLLGGDANFISTLNKFFEDAEQDLAIHPLDDIVSNAEPRIHYWHGNEPDIHAAYLFSQLGRDDLTQRWLQWIRTELYNDGPGGLAGNDDSGTLSSWYVWSALGIYPVAGSDRYFVGMPLFPKATVRTASGTLTIEAPAADGAQGVVSVRVGEVLLQRAQVRHQDLSGDVTLRFEMADSPTAWSLAD